MAQPVLFSHWVLSQFWKLSRDAERLSQLTARVSVCPLGSGALAGTPYPIDRDALASQAGLPKVEEAVLDLATAGFTVRRILDVIPESDAQVLEALASLSEAGILAPNHD